MGIPLASNFDVNAALPLDSRMVVADLTARDAIVSGRRFEGMCVYVVADTKTYQLQGGVLNADWAEYGSAIAAATFVEKFSGDGGTLVFTLTNDPLAIENTQVYVHGIYQQKTSSYTLSTADIEFIEAPPIGTDNIEVIYTTPTGTLVIPDNYITSVHIADDAVTTDKILSMDAAKLTGTLDIARIADGSITAAKLDPAAITIANNSITESKLEPKPFASGPAITYTRSSGSGYVDIPDATFTITKAAENSNKTIRFTLIPALTNTASRVSTYTTNALNIKLVANGVDAGIHSISAMSGLTFPVSAFVWYHNSATTAAVTYKLQIDIGTITNARFAWEYI